MKRQRFIIWLAVWVMCLCGCGIVSQAKVKDARRYMIRINKQQNVVTVYRQVEGKKYRPYKAFVCSAGWATPTGTFYMREKIRWHVLNGGHYGQYCSRIYRGILFHSVWYYRRDKRTQSYVQYNRLGSLASQGCIRLTVIDAKWIYDNCASGTKIVIYNSPNPGPLGKPKAVKVRGYSGWDPTDPDPANPYWKKKPSITVPARKTIRYAASVEPRKGIRARDSFGKDISAKIKIRIKYKALAKDKYKEVKQINSRRPGIYRLDYCVTDRLRHTARRTAIWKVVVAREISSIKLNQAVMTLYTGGEAAEARGLLRIVKILPERATYKKVRFVSSVPKIAAVSDQGVVMAKKAGRAVIRAYALDGSGRSAVCQVIVKNAGASPPGGEPGVVSDTAIKMAD